jgi:hypothetical protein
MKFTPMIIFAGSILLTACSTMHNADRNVEINSGSVENRAADDQPSKGPARRAPPPANTEGTATSPAVPGPTQNNTGAATTTTQDRWNSSPPNKTVPSAAPPNQQ